MSRNEMIAGAGHNRCAAPVIFDEEIDWTEIQVAEAVLDKS